MNAARALQLRIAPVARVVLLAAMIVPASLLFGERATAQTDAVGARDDSAVTPASSTEAQRASIAPGVEVDGVAARIAAAESAAARAEAMPENDPDAARRAFMEAAEQWELLLADGRRAFSVHFNAGNARLRAGQPDRALAHYLAAQRLEPRNAALRDNLINVRAALADADAEAADPSPWDAIVGFSRWLRLNERIAVAAAAWVIFWSALMLRRLRPGLAALPGLMFFSVAAFLVAAGMIAVDAMDALGPTAVVVDQPAALRQPRGGGFAPAGGVVVAPGDVVHVRDVRAAWIHVEASSGKTGWIPRQAAVFVDDPRWPFSVAPDLPAIATDASTP